MRETEKMAKDKNRPAARKSTAPRKIAGRPLLPDAGSSSAAEHDSSGRSSGAPEVQRAHEAEPSTEQSPPAERTRSRTVVLAVVALVVGLASGIAGVTLAVLPGDEPDNRAFVDRGATEEVLRLASTHAQRLVAIDHTELDAYHESLDEFLAPNLVEELDATWDTLRRTYEQTQTAVDAQTQNVGLSFLTEDRAEVLLVLSVSMTRDGVASGSTLQTETRGHFRRMRNETQQHDFGRRL